MLNLNILICDCGTEIEYASNGELLESIDCKCGRHIYWVTGAGYYYDDENFNMISLS